MRRAQMLVAAGALLTTAQAPRDAATRLNEAKAQSAAASERAARLDQAAQTEAGIASKARTAEAAVAARIRAAEADIVAAQARIAIVGELLARQRATLALQQGPLVRLIAALQSLAARPSIVALAQPGSVDDLVHVRAVLGTTIPQVEARTAEVRADLKLARKLEQDAMMASKALADSRARLEKERLALARLEAEHRLKSKALGRDALFESDRAIALGERARDLAGAVETSLGDALTGQSLARLPGPLPRPPQEGETAAMGAPVTADGRSPYRLPVEGRIVMGLGETATSGVRSRGVTLLPAAAATVFAPAAGRVVFAGPFRNYSRVIIIDHGGGWTTALTGLGEAAVSVGQPVSVGTMIGRARSGDDPAVTVELRRRGRPVDLISLLG